ncbi:MAG: ATP-dependent protease subunit HslV [Desulfobacula sp.]|uniref:ATP-dependent protease subunit HslV n=1 Tax=Desulfobacula sp. TaxID=2593537 RepID=UPI001D42DCE5|nr:ATP-dependent protease subunit HslV [Desulfobacula sp.]MBT3486911.1 ATP-dependent protease subunit HslV [Desulfobacula sp.]MBT3805613.1 ATP-dependent protease subunit HslV [Desulfobacula sp.]MBT4026485.1 ATP-dependent protease subunit HslV [Desulfobacula sp.]MBT4506943.1 ATP-dependent protease subunit HslV [Desulfobacula sp.]
MNTEKFHGTTILALRHKDSVVVAGDGQVTLGSVVTKHKARKVRRIYNDKIIVGFAGATADALTLSEKLETKLERYNGNLTRACVELARDWRTDKYLRRLEAMMIASDQDNTYLLSGNGDVIEPDDGVISIGSGSTAAQSAAIALIENTDLESKDIVEKAMKIAADLCIYTNHHIIVEEL